MKENKKEILNSGITFPVVHYKENINICNKKLTNHLLLLQYEVKNFIFSLKYKYRQQKVDLSTNQKSLVFVTIIIHRKCNLYAQLSYTKILYSHKNTHLQKDVAFLHFRLKGSSENMIFP